MGRACGSCCLLFVRMIHVVLLPRHRSSVASVIAWSSTVEAVTSSKCAMDREFVAVVKLVSCKTKTNEC
jgi:hypothetical protein